MSGSNRPVSLRWLGILAIENRCGISRLVVSAFTWTPKAYTIEPFIGVGPLFRLLFGGF